MTFGMNKSIGIEVIGLEDGEIFLELVGGGGVFGGFGSGSGTGARGGGLGGRHDQI